MLRRIEQYRLRFDLPFVSTSCMWLRLLCAFLLLRGRMFSDFSVILPAEKTSGMKLQLKEGAGFPNSLLYMLAVIAGV